jgi:gluconate 2-dehydrogenase gamma chain
MEPEEVSGSAENPSRTLTRRVLIGRGAAVAGGVALLGAPEDAAAKVEHAGAMLESGHRVSLTRPQMGTLKAVLADLLPKDNLGPGAVEAGVHVYIDRALAGSYQASRPVYAKLLALFEKSARSMGAKSYATLPAAKRTKLLASFEAGKPIGVPHAQGAAVAGGFALLLEHMREGMFGDPMYGGNRNLSGWKLIGYPDILLTPTVQNQRVNGHVRPTGKTARTFGGRPYNGPPV